MKKFNIYLRYVLIGLLVLSFTETTQAQIGITPVDTTVCPGDAYTIRGRFATSNAPNSQDDQYTNQIINLGFDFVFYGDTYNQCKVSSNNFITFDMNKSGYSSWTWTGALNAGDLNNSIFFPFHDINFAVGGTINYQTFGSAPNRIFVIEFCKVPLYSCNTSLVTDQLILYEGTNVIEMHIKDKPTCGWNQSTAVEGIRHNNQEALVPGRDAPGISWTATNDARRFTPDANWNYTIDTIPFAPINILVNVDSNQIKWYEEGNPNSIHTGPNLPVIVDPNVHYYVAEISGQSCNDNTTAIYKDTSWVHFGTTYDTLRVEMCGDQTYNFFGRELNRSGQYDTAFLETGGCDSFVTLYLTVDPMPDVTLDQADLLSMCQGDSVIISVANPLASTTYQWNRSGSPIVGRTGPIYISKGSGTFSVTATTDKGCVATSSPVEVTVYRQPDAKIAPIGKEIICAYDTLALSATDPGAGDDYRWYPTKPFYTVGGNEGSKVKGVFLDESTMVKVIVTTRHGCFSEDSVLVRTKPCCEVFIPNAFTPNGDGLNDNFMPELQLGQIITNLRVFNRYGEVVYSQKQPNKGWDGTMKDGKAAPADTYMYRVEYTCADGKLYVKKGSVNLLR